MMQKRLLIVIINFMCILDALSEDRNNLIVITNADIEVLNTIRVSSSKDDKDNKKIFYSDIEGDHIDLTIFNIKDLAYGEYIITFSPSEDNETEAVHSQKINFKKGKDVFFIKFKLFTKKIKAEGTFLKKNKIKVVVSKKGAPHYFVLNYLQKANNLFTGSFHYLTEGEYIATVIDDGKPICHCNFTINEKDDKEKLVLNFKKIVNYNAKDYKFLDRLNKKIDDGDK